MRKSCCHCLFHLLTKLRYQFLYSFNHSTIFCYVILNICDFFQEILSYGCSINIIIHLFNCVFYQVFLAHPLQPYYPPPVHGISNGMDNSTNRSLGLAQMDPNSTEAPSNFPESFLMENQPNTALLSVILTLGTFFIAYFLKQFRNSKFLGRSVSCSSLNPGNLSGIPRSDLIYFF